MTPYTQIESLLIDIEVELRQLQQWQDQPPSPQALASVEPFCIDTLSFAQWLQFVFLPRMRALAVTQQLPAGRCQVAPLAQEYFRDSQLDVARLIHHIDALDRVVNAAADASGRLQ